MSFFSFLFFLQREEGWSGADKVRRGSDFVFGLTAGAWFERIDLRVKGPGWVTASGRDSDANPSYYVFNNW